MRFLAPQLLRYSTSSRPIQAAGWTGKGVFRCPDSCPRVPPSAFLESFLESVPAPPLNGVDVTGPVVVPNTVNWNRWGSSLKAPVYLPAGRNALRFVVDQAFAGLHSLRFMVAQAPFGGTPWPLPGTIKAVDFDEGGEQISYHDNTAGCDGLCSYRTAEVDYYGTTVWHTSIGEWMEYTVDVTTTGVYTMSFRVGSQEGGGTFHLEVDGVNATGPLTVPTTGSWAAFQTVTKTGVSLTAGRHILRLVVDDDAGQHYAGTFDTITVQP